MTERLDLIVDVFHALDKDEDGRLNEIELLRFARYYEFYDTDERWSVVYRSLCDSLQWDADSGIGVTTFASFVDTRAYGCYCDDELLQWMLEELCPPPPKPELPVPLGNMAGMTAMHEVASMFESLKRVKAHFQGLETPKSSKRPSYSPGTPGLLGSSPGTPGSFGFSPSAAGLMGFPGIPGMSAEDAAKLIAAGGKKPDGDTKPYGVHLRRKTWTDCPWLTAQPATEKVHEEAADASQDLDPLGFDSLPDELDAPISDTPPDALDPLGIDSLPDTLDPLGIDSLPDVMPGLDPSDIETMSIRRLEPEETADSSSRAKRLQQEALRRYLNRRQLVPEEAAESVATNENMQQEALRPPAWLCEQFPKRKHWRSWRVCSLRVDEEVGAGLELEATLAGHRVHDVDHFPGQVDALCAGTVIMCIDGHPLVGLDEESLDDAFDSRLRDGVEVMLMDWEELQEALDEKDVEPGSHGIAAPEASMTDSSASGSQALPADGTWTRGSGRRVVAGASERQRTVHERLDERLDDLAEDDSEEDETEQAPLDRFNPRRSSLLVSNAARHKEEGNEQDVEASRQLFFDLGGPPPVMDLCELTPDTSFNRAMKMYAGNSFHEETHPLDFTPGAQLKYLTGDAEGAMTAPDPSMDMRWVSLEERHAMDAAHDIVPRRSSQPREVKLIVEEDAGQKPDAWARSSGWSKPAAKSKSMPPMPKARPLGGGPRPLGGGPQPLTLGGQLAGSSGLGIGSRGYPLGASSSSWTGRPADDEMGEFYSFRVPKSAGKPPRSKFQERLAAAKTGEPAKAKAESVEHRLATEETVDVD